MRLQEMKEHVVLQATLPCGGTDYVPVHKQASLKALRPEEPFFLLDQDDFGTLPGRQRHYLLLLFPNLTFASESIGISRTMTEKRRTNQRETEKMVLPERLANDIGAMLSGSLAYLGDRLGLFAALAEVGPAPAERLAQAANCHPRYVREWLAAMTVAGWVEYDPDKEAYWLPQAHVSYLVEEEHPLYLGGWLAAIVPLAEATRSLLNCFRHGGGLTATDHHPDLPHILRRLDGPLIHNYLTTYWLPQLLSPVEQRLTAGVAVADIGCGTGRTLVEMAGAYPNSSFTGYEPDERSARLARMALIREGLDGQVSVVQAGSEGLAGRCYEFIMALNTINEMVDPAGAIADIYQALTTNGVCLFLERHHSNKVAEMPAAQGRLLYALSTLYTLPLSLAHNGAGLGVAAGRESLQEMCRRAGFSRFTPLNFPHPFVALYAAYK